MFKFKKTIILFALFLLLFTTNSVFALNLQDAFKTSDGTLLQNSATAIGYKTDNTVTIYSIVGNIITMVLSFLGIIFLILMVYAGYLWMMAQGNDEQVTRARNMITAAIIGLVIVVSAYAISYFVIEKIGAGSLEETATELKKE